MNRDELMKLLHLLMNDEEIHLALFSKGFDELTDVLLNLNVDLANKLKRSTKCPHGNPQHDFAAHIHNKLVDAVLRCVAEIKAIHAEMEANPLYKDLPNLAEQEVGGKGC